MSRELLTWASLFNRFDLIDEILKDTDFQEYVKNNTKLLKSDPKADMSVMDSFSADATQNAPLTLHTGIAQAGFHPAISATSYKYHGPKWAKQTLHSISP